MYTESTWGPCESVSKSQRTAQPYRLQKANKCDGQWYRWASDVRQSQPDQWSDSSAKWASSAGDDSSWKRASEWEGSQWSIPTKWTLKGSDYDIDREWHSRNMRYGEGWAYDSSRSYYIRGRSQQELILKMIEKKIQRYLWDPRPRRMIHRMTTPCGRERIASRIGGSLPHREINGSPGYGLTETYRAWQEILQKPALHHIASRVSMREMETQ